MKAGRIEMSQIVNQKILHRTIGTLFTHCLVIPVGKHILLELENHIFYKLHIQFAIFGNLWLLASLKTVLASFIVDLLTFL